MLVWESLLLIGLIVIGVIAEFINYDKFFDWLDNPVQKKERRK